MSKKKILSLGLVIEAITFIVLSILWKGQYDDKLFDGLRIPWELLGDGLRQLSWAGTFGNVISWIIYLVVSLMPIIVAVFFVKQKKAGPEEILMAILSITIFRGVYMFINPSEILEVEGMITLPGYKNYIVITICSMIVLYATIKLLKVTNDVKEEKLITILKYICGIAMVVIVASFSLVGVSELVINIETALKNNLYTVNTCILLGIRFLAGQLPNLCLIVIINKLMDVAGAICKGYFNEAVLTEVDKITRICKNSIIIILFSIMFLNLGQLLLTSYVSIAHFTLSVPVFEILLIIVILLVSRMISESHKIKEDNDLFI